MSLKRAMSLRLFCLISGFMTAFALAPNLAAQPVGPMERLAKMQQALADGSYDGTFSFYTGNDLASLRVVHKVVNGERRERLVHLNGSPREFLRRGDTVSSIYMPGDNLLEGEGGVPSGPFSRSFVRHFETLNDNYDLTLSGSTDYVAGRKTSCIEISPKDKHRFGYRLWVDDEHDLLLRSELIDEQGQRLEIFQFSQIVFGDEVSDAALQAETPAGSRVSEMALEPMDEQVEALSTPWKLAWLPAGFEMSASDQRGADQDASALRTLTYSDGLAAFTVFIEVMPKSGAAMMRSRNGATVAINGKVVGPNRVDHLITLVGELPTATAKRILGHVRYQP